MTPSTRHTIWIGLYIVTLLLLAGTVSAGEGPQFMIKINDVIFLTDNDIVSYNWQSHSITITAEAEARIDSCWPKYLLDEWPSNSVGRFPRINTFSVIANGEIVYSGRVVYLYSSSSYFQMGPLLCWPFFKVGSSRIDIAQYDGRDTRSDARIKDVLANLGVLMR